RDEYKAMNKSHEEGAAKIMELLDQQKNTPLNIAITGESGSGKSTFVNVFRGITDEDESAAPTGPVETTKEVTPYHHPKYPNVKLWDLPGIGTTTFPADKYLEHVGFEKFDFFIIISDTRFRENDVKLAREIQRMKKTFYFVRSKIDNDIRSEQKKREFSAEDTLTTIRNSCTEGLQNEDIESPQVFLVSAFEPHLYDFSNLGETLEKQLPAHKRHTLLLAMPVINLEIVNKKKEVFQGNIKYHAALSVLLSSSAVLDKLITEYQAGFGLDCESLQKLADRTGLPLTDLKAVMKSPLTDNERVKALFTDILSLSARAASGAVDGEELNFFSALGILGTTALSCWSTYNSINRLYCANEILETNLRNMVSNQIPWMALLWLPLTL
uniref:IRG-type G domain-containing protein n=1 Tax=Amphilophus citrinellus TaxID=61819 RepID=A0A3Q0RQZ4_AMPCI